MEMSVDVTGFTQSENGVYTRDQRVFAVYVYKTHISGLAKAQVWGDVVLTDNNIYSLAFGDDLRFELSEQSNQVAMATIEAIPTDTPGYCNLKINVLLPEFATYRKLVQRLCSEK